MDLREDYRRRLLRFVSDAVHDLVGPVDQVGSLVGLLVRRYAGESDADAQELLRHIDAAAARLAVTAAGLRRYFQTTGAECGRTRVDSRAALESALLTLHYERVKSQAEISFGDLPEITGDPHLMEELFRALIENSLKFHRPGIAPRLAITAECVPNVWRFSISDNGMGIDPAFREEVFVGFRKLNGHAYPGAGLGLTVARAIVEAHGGRIWIAESSAPGTTVIFELPV